MEYIQISNSVVNLIGDEEVGLPLSDKCLSQNPDMLCINRTYLEEVQVVWYYHSDTKIFSKYLPEERTTEPDVIAPNEKHDPINRNNTNY